MGSISTACLVVAAGFMLTAAPLEAQLPPGMTPDQLMNLMQSQPRLAVNAPVAPAASFDPPVISAGGKATYRVALHTLDEAITRWPDKMPVPEKLTLERGAEGMIFSYGAGTMAPLTVINYHAMAGETGTYIIPSYQIEIYGQPVTIPEARLEVVPASPAFPSVRQLLLEPARTNVYVGQSVRVRVLNPAGADRVMPMLQQVQLNGDGFIAGKGDVRQQISNTHLSDGRDVLAFIYDTSITPFSRGALTISAQGFTAGNQVSGQIVIRGGVTIPGGPPEFALLESEPVTLNVVPLPAEGKLPGFNGAIGKFNRSKPQLSATSVTAGNPVTLAVTFTSETGIAHLGMPEPPETPAWEAFSTGAPQFAGNNVTFTYTLIPQTDQTAATPEIPFSYFDPDLGKYQDLSIPSVAIKVLPGPAATAANNAMAPNAAGYAPEKKLSLSPLSAGLGQTAAALTPLEARGWFWLVQLGPVVVVLALWIASRRRLYWEHHPDLVRRRQARRALRRECSTLRQAAQSGNAKAFAASAVQAIRLACSPHFPAEPRALVCGDILQLLPEAERTGEFGRMVRRLFLAVDAFDFAGTPGDTAGLLELQAPLDRLLAELEARL